MNDKRKKVILLNVISFVVFDLLYEKRKETKDLLDESFLKDNFDGRFKPLSAVKQTDSIASYFEIIGKGEPMFCFSGENESLDELLEGAEGIVDDYIKYFNPTLKEMEEFLEEMERDFFAFYKGDLSYVNLLLNKLCDKYNLTPAFRKPLLYVAS
ncbi:MULTISPECIES: hypothetical protein [Pantoea]|jgi:hypothetical protein|uniref:Uncharacterized protein n=1 Tax=Pantoea brenneri TaxID=472694 RepID=A0A7Y6TUD6_9GAMM|nr:MULTISPECIES: hypothetical protein [Pantoea]MBZ6397560.1 hypothetical protein [Pantoea sp.]MBZ6440709.1 hypothetical protein [Pantoea sp.]NUY44185.1 hypothetical protein [Pantoea brenneri]NUY51656.1 hypothetical protein [Pantoea brenneri]NUY61950.1 hypothetical protein [Pantoea brenneri]